MQVGVRAGGVADNVLPGSGTITVNCRTLPGGACCLQDGCCMGLLQGAALRAWFLRLTLHAATTPCPALSATQAGQEPSYVGEYLAAVTRKEGAHVSLRQLPKVGLLSFVFLPCCS